MYVVSKSVVDIPVIDKQVLLAPKQELFYQGKASGYEAIMQKQASDMTWDNPWIIDQDIHELPVFRNLHRSDDVGEMVVEDEDAIMELANRYAKKFAFSIESYENFMGIYTFQCDQGEIVVRQDQSVTIWFSDSYKKQNNEHLKEPTSKQIALDNLKECYNKHSDSIDFVDPAYIASLEYGFDFEKIQPISMWSYRVYEGSQDVIENFLSYSFKNVEFMILENELCGIRFYQEDISESIGNYPIITSTMAKERLLKGQYYASAPIANFDEIIYVELVYHINRTNEYFMPYYRFYAPLKDDSYSKELTGLDTYGAYYVPAITDEYLKDLPQNERFYNY